MLNVSQKALDNLREMMRADQFTGKGLIITLRGYG